MKYVKLFENFSNKAINFKDLVGKKFKIQYGSGSTSTITGWKKDDLLDEIKKSIEHYLFDWNFYSNWTDKRSEYLEDFNKDILEPMMNDIDNTLKNWFVFNNNTLSFVKDEESSQQWIDNWFMKNETDYQQDYYEYRKEYAGVKLDYKSVVQRVLSESKNWKLIDPPIRKEYDYQLEYKINDKLKIRLVFDNRYPEAIDYLLIETFPSGEDKTWNWMFKYYDKEMFHDVIDDYERMMKVCEFHIEYFEKEPNDSTLSNIHDCFIEIEDILGESSTPPQYGYFDPNISTDDDMVAFIPALDEKYKLGIIIPWYQLENINKKELNEEFNYCKDRVKQYTDYKEIDILYNYPDYYSNSGYEVFIKIVI